MFAVIFPGQGSQSLGMAKDFYDTFPTVKKIFEDVKKTSPKYLLCKVNSSLSSFKNNLSKKKESKKKSGKKSIFKKFGEAKTLSDLN